MASDSPDAHTGPPPAEQPTDPSGTPFVIATVALFAFVLGIMGLLALGGWIAFGFAIALLLSGVFAVVRYVQHIA